MARNRDLLNALNRMGTERDQRDLAETFGVDPDMIKEPTEYDQEQAGREMRHEQMCAAIANLATVIRGGSEAQVKAIEGNVLELPSGLATDKGIEKAVKALAKVIESAIRAQPDITPVLERLCLALEKEPEEPVANGEDEDEDDESMLFEIQRDRNGFMTSVIARPYEEPEPEDTGMTIN